jgi:hypothetical protein
MAWVTGADHFIPSIREPIFTDKVIGEQVIMRCAPFLEFEKPEYRMFDMWVMLVGIS